MELLNGLTRSLLPKYAVRQLPCWPLAFGPGRNDDTDSSYRVVPGEAATFCVINGLPPSTRLDASRGRLEHFDSLTATCRSERILFHAESERLPSD